MKGLSRLIVTVLSVALLINSVSVYAAGPSAEAPRHEAFLRGGNAIAEALNAKTETVRLVSPAIEEAIPAQPVPMPAPQEGKKSMNKAVWASLIAGFAVSGILIYHYATGPGASVRNCSTCK